MKAFIDLFRKSLIPVRKSGGPFFFRKRMINDTCRKSGQIGFSFADHLFYRLDQEFLRYALAITRQNMANGMIRLGEEYLAILYEHLHSLLYSYHVIQTDETPVPVNRDGRNAGSKSYIWVYRSGRMHPEKQIILYKCQRIRKASHPREFLKDYSGIYVMDGYQVYHTLEKERENLTIAGC